MSEDRDRPDAESDVDRGPPVADEEDAYRAILYPMWWAQGMNRPSSAAFDQPKFSVDIASKSTPEESAARFRDVSRVVRFNCGRAREFTFDTRDEIDDEFPENQAHAHVYFDDYERLGNSKQRKRHIRKFIDYCETIEIEVRDPSD